jgi:hypothetical protein
MALIKLNTRSIPDDAVTPAKVSQNLGRRNIIINGNYRVAQRGTSIADPTSGDIAMDRWILGMQTTTGVTTVTQSTDVPTAAESGSNFVNSIKWDVTTADTSIAVTDRAYMQYKVEGQDISQAGFGQSGTRYMTLSFWHKHTKTGIHSVAVNNGARDRSYPMEYTQTTSDTWEKAELTFTVDTTGTWVTNSGVGAIIFFPLIMGSNYHGTANQWGTGQKYGTANQVNNLDSTSNNMLWTGVQLELGSVATDFEHRSYVEELAACQRYCNVIGNDAHYMALGIGTMYTATNGIFYVTTATAMRSTPSLTTVAASSGSNSGKWLNSYIGSSGTITNASPELGENSTNGLANSFRIYVPLSNGSTTIGLSSWNMVITGAKFILSAEL